MAEQDTAAADSLGLSRLRVFRRVTRTAGCCILRILTVAWVLLLSGTADAAVEGRVVCALGDPYRPLANEIALETGYGLVDTPTAALGVDPAILIWVVAPAHFSDRDLVAYALQARDRSSSVALGFITGPTLEPGSPTVPTAVISWEASTICRCSIHGRSSRSGTRSKR